MVASPPSSSCSLLSFLLPLCLSSPFPPYHPVLLVLSDLPFFCAHPHSPLISPSPSPPLSLTLLSQRLDGGLFTLQQLSAIIVFACLYDKENHSLEKAQIKLEGEDLYLEDILNVLREAAVHMYEKKKSESVNGDSTMSAEEREKEEGRESVRKLFVDWSMAAGTLSVLDKNQEETDNKQE
jgi:hypothetical protein